MAIVSDCPRVRAVAWRASLASIVSLLGLKLSAAQAYTSRTNELEAHRKIEHALGRKLEPRFALELVRLLLTQGSESRELRTAFFGQLRMTESPQWTAALAQCQTATVSTDDEARFLASEEAASLQDFARCGACLARSAAEREGTPLTGDEAARFQWAACAECRCGSADWDKR